LRQLTAGTGVVVLDNEVLDLDVNGQTVRIGGISYNGDESRAAAAIQQLTNRATGAFVPPPEAVPVPGEEATPTTEPIDGGAANEDPIVGQVDPNAPEGEVAVDPNAPAVAPSQNDDVFRILLVHKPDEIERLPGDDSVNLVVAGHTHGGQIRFPGFPPPVIFADVPRTVGGGGLHRLDDHWIYVSTGVGRERGRAPQVRLGVRPSIGILTTVDVTTVVLPDN